MLQYEVSDGVGLVTFNRPDVLNAFNDELGFAALDAVNGAADDDNVRCIVITGAGRAFSSGEDLGTLADGYRAGEVPDLGETLVKRYNPLIRAIRSAPKPVVAAVNGVAAGAGASVAFACDFRITSEKAKFVLAFVDVGLVPDSGAVWFLTKMVGTAKAWELAATGAPLSADEALRLEVVVVEKGQRGRGSSPWAQGGVAAALGPDDSPELHAQDTLRVAAGHGDPSAVAVLCSEAPECVLQLAELGCDFERTESGELHVAREGGQTVPRSVHSGDATGAAIMKTLREHAGPRVTRVEGVCFQLAIVDGRCSGAWALTDDGVVEINATSTVLASGGIGALYPLTTNPAGATGDGLVLAWEAGAGIADLEFVQFHPTALALGSEQQHLLITEALRGAGAHVVDADGRRFLFEHHSDGELAPRDVVARAIAGRHTWIDARHLGRELLEHEFPTVVDGCRQHGIDL